MSDAKYWIVRNMQTGSDFISLGFPKLINDLYECIVPTYTVSELLYKLHEWIYPTIGGKEYSGGLQFFKDAPFYVFYYGLKHKESDTVTLTNSDYICSEFDNPIESLASVLLQCHQKDIGFKCKDIGNIQDKYNQ